VGSEKGKGLDCGLYSEQRREVEQGERESKNSRRVDESEKSWEKSDPLQSARET
jgi:hypothetical protein